jgi:hypothetical protein
MPVPESMPAPPVVNWTRRTLLGAAGTAAVAGCAGLIFARRKPRVERAVLTGSLLTALDGLGRPIWEQRLPGAVQEPLSRDFPWRVQVVDLEGTGNPGVLVVSSPASKDYPQSVGIDEVSYFGADSQLRWTFPCKPPLLDFDGKEFEPVWWCSQALALPANGGSKDLWVAINHDWRWPGCIMRVDAKGHGTVQFANAGHVEALCRLSGRSENLIAIVGENNGFEVACAAILGVQDPPSSSPPGKKPRCQYRESPSGTVREYMLFPRTEMIQAVDAPYGHAKYVRGTADGGFVAEVIASNDDGSTLLYEFGKDSEPKNVMPSGGCATKHRRLELDGKLHHSWADCPELKNPLTVSHWRRGGTWQDEQFPWRAISDTQ